MIVKILIDNITKDEMIHEWGLSIYIEYEGHKFLLDTGASGKFVRNAARVNVNLKEVEFGILSHAHYDHSDGMALFFENNQKANFYIRNGSLENCYWRKWLFGKYVGIQKGLLEAYKDRVIYADGDYEIITGVYLIPHKTAGLDQIGKKANMYVKQNRKWYPDSFAHEQSLVFDTEKGLVIFNSCSHGGADNIINEVSDTFPNKKIHALIGGFHLYESPQNDVRALAERIKDTGIEKVFTGHCTGKKSFAILKEELQDQIEQLYTGMEFEL